MNKETRILIIEDSVADAELAERELRQAGISFISRRVETKAALLQELHDFQPDIILSDYGLPQFTGLEALRLLKERGIEVPFILVTGSLTEEVAVECMKEGADDYILKSSLKRLPSAVLNVLEKKAAQRQKEEALAAMARSDELSRLIAENTHDLICILDLEGNFVYVSPSYGKILGYDPQELISKNAFSLIHAEDRDRVEQTFRLALITKEDLNAEFRYEHCQGNWLFLEAIGSWVFDGKENPWRAVIVSRDITERKRSDDALREAQEQLRLSQKLEAMGQLAGGVAHDFNNMLTVISGYSEILLRQCQADNSMTVKIEEIRKAAKRSASLTRQLLAFSRKQVLQAEVIDLNSLIENMGKMLCRLIGENIEIVTVLNPDIRKIKADPGQIEQVVMNLVVNARDAMPNGGKIVIETTGVDLDVADERAHVGVKAGQYLRLAISDTGCGIDAETQKHIFEPFFTTKELGKGTGLGLSTVYGIVKQSEGNIWVSSEVGKGTTFNIYLPLIKAGAQLPAGNHGEARPQKGWETLLVVEDESMVRDLARSLLQEAGYKVLDACGGDDALRIEEHYDGTIHLMITDVVMPQMSGQQLAEHMAQRRPETKVLYVSGYASDTIFRDAILEEGISFLEKPFTTSSLVLKVRAVLDRALVEAYA
jgi:two-component system cell cycle sensor histidine kinase/response regulator CckA